MTEKKDDPNPLMRALQSVDAGMRGGANVLTGGNADKFAGIMNSAFNDKPIAENIQIEEARSRSVGNQWDYRIGGAAAGATVVTTLGVIGAAWMGAGIALDRLHVHKPDAPAKTPDTQVAPGARLKSPPQH